MNPRQLTVLAPGLLGGSVAMAAKARAGLSVDRVVVWARRPEVRQALAAQPWCDAVASTLAEAVVDAGLVVLAAPVEKIIEMAEHVAPLVAPGAVVTDVGSVKGHLTRRCTAALQGRATFVGSHPMAGGAKTGWENGSADLFVGRVCFITPLPETPEPALTRVQRFWADLGSDCVTVDPDTHDEIVAHISHLPQAVATSLANALAGRPDAWRNYAGGGLRDTTRIAASDATMWVEIFQQNRDEVLRALGTFEDHLHSLKTAIANGDWTEVRRRLETGKTYRDAFRPLP